MKVSRRGLGGLFAGGVAAVQGMTGARPANPIYPSVPADAGKMATLAGGVPQEPDPLERARYLLKRRESSYLDYYRKRPQDSYAMEPDPDIDALKSCSASGRDVILRSRRARRAFEDEKLWAAQALEEHLKQYPWIKALIT